MSIVSEITRINTNIANAYSKIEEKGGTLPQEQNSSNLVTSLTTIPSPVEPDVSKPVAALENMTDDLVQKIKNYYPTVLATYIPDTDEPVTIYVPSGDVYHLWKYYFIYYRSDIDAFRIVLFEDNNPRCIFTENNEDAIGTMCIKPSTTSSSPSKGVCDPYWYFNTSYYNTLKVRYSSNYTNLSDLITAITTNSSYTTTSTTNKLAFPTGSYIIYSNVPIIDTRNGKLNATFLTGLKRISSNEIYHY